MSGKEPSYRILIIDDHPDTARMMQMMVEMLGHSARVARCIGEGLETVSRETFDLVVVDYRLPDGTGWDLLQMLPSREPVRAVLVTAHDPGFLEPSRLEGFSACLTKPVDLNELRRVIERLCPN